jgi:hypothetical protein
MENIATMKLTDGSTGNKPRGSRAKLVAAKRKPRKPPRNPLEIFAFCAPTDDEWAAHDQDAGKDSQ